MGEATMCQQLFHILPLARVVIVRALQPRCCCLRSDGKTVSEQGVSAYGRGEGEAGSD